MPAGENVLKPIPIPIPPMPIPTTAAPTAPVRQVPAQTVSNPTIRTVGQLGTAQPYRPGKDDRDMDSQTIDIDLTPPGHEKLFRLESERSWKERLQQKRRHKGLQDPLEFPKEPSVSKEVYAGRAWPCSTEYAEPNYVCYRRPYFEQVNLQRYGWDLGFVTPAVSTSKFFWDVFWLPHNLATEPGRHFECNRGYCLPGDPTPLYWYPPNPSLTGMAAQGAALTGVLYAFP
jgi:hypothetical protein